MFKYIPTHCEPNWKGKRGEKEEEEMVGRAKEKEKLQIELY